MDSAAAFALLKMPKHETILLKEISAYQWNEHFSDLTCQCQDGIIRTHRVILCSTSPTLKQLLERPEFETEATLILPDISKEQLTLLLGLLYTGRINLYKRELDDFVSLTHLLKLVSMPAALIEQTWTKRFDDQDKPVEIKSDVKQPRTTKMRQNEDRATVKAVKSVRTILTTKRTRSGRQVVRKKFADEILGNSNIPSGTKDIEVGKIVPEVESAKDVIADFASGPKKINHNPDDPLTIAPSSVGIDELLTVAAAVQLSRQPDFHEVSPAAFDGSDTKKLLRECYICSTHVLGRNALGRHMKNVHPKVFGPFSCPVSECGKSLESGFSLMQHVQGHLCPRAQALAKGERFPCPKCDSVYTTESRMNAHLREKHGEKAGYNQPRFSCNADVPCDEVFATAKDFSAHMNSVHDVKPWKCDHCHKRFKEKQNYKFHMMTHDGNKGYMCDICEKSFITPRQLYAHRSLHLGRRFFCVQCGYKARSSANLRGHTKAKHEGTQVECPHCCKRFSSANNLKNHVRIHTGETPYECDLCDVRFKRIHHLHSHIESKSHADMMDQCRREGRPVPLHLDPVRRIRGRDVVRDGPITYAAISEGQAVEIAVDVSEKTSMIQELNIVPGQNMVVITESGEEAYVIPIEGENVEIIDSESVVILPESIHGTSQFAMEEVSQ